MGIFRVGRAAVDSMTHTSPMTLFAFTRIQISPTDMNSSSTTLILPESREKEFSEGVFCCSHLFCHQLGGAEQYGEWSAQGEPGTDWLTVNSASVQRGLFI